MKENLVFVEKGKLFCDSLMFSEKFETKHRNVTRDIRNLTALFGAVRNEFIESEWINDRNRKYSKFNMTRKGFMFLVMNTNVTPEKKQKLYEVQNAIIDAFEYMENLILKEKVNKQNIEWNKTREQGKQIRLETTDTIKNFVEYATNQGSKSANMYYKHFTTATYKALQFMQQVKPKLRDTLDLLELNQLILAENLCKERIDNYMKENLHYKEIYILVKQDIEKFANSLFIGK